MTSSAASAAVSALTVSRPRLGASGYADVVGEEVEILGSARKHGVDDEDIRHPYAHPIRSFSLDDDLTMIIGASKAAALLEIGVVTRGARV